MSLIDIDEYPDDTEEILLVLWKREQQKKDEEYGNKSMKRRMLATQTTLNKQQVRYRVNKLVEDGYMSRDTVTEHNQRVTYYALRPSGRKSARAIHEAQDVLGKIPENIGRQDVLKLTNEIAALRAEIEAAGFDMDSIEKSKFMKEIEHLDHVSKLQWNEIEDLKEYSLEDANRIDDIEIKLGMRQPD